MIEQFGTDFPPEAVRCLLDQGLAQVGIRPHLIERICVATADRYGSLLTEISGGGTLPVGPVLISLGWTWARMVGVNITSTIVLLDQTVKKALAGNQRHAFVIAHELGHAADFAARGKVSIPDMPYTEPFRLEPVTGFYLERFLQEFGANRHAASAMSEQRLDHDLREVGKVIKRGHAIVQNHLNRYCEGQIPNAHLADQVTNAAWEMMVSMGAIHGYLFTDAAISAPARGELDKIDHYLEGRLRPISERIATEYPHPSLASLEGLQKAWLSTLQTWHFSFRATPVNSVN